MNKLKYSSKQILKKCFEFTSKCKFLLFHNFYKPLKTFDYDYSLQEVLKEYTPQAKNTYYNEPFKYDVSLCLSIIVPVYNVKDYLPRCIKSLIQPTKYKYEIILIDDGSSDGSSLICDEFASKYNFIKVIHKNNEGVSASRNTGLIHSHGKYILFIDSDDFLLKDSLSRIDLANLEFDIFQYRHQIYCSKKIIAKSQKIKEKDPLVLNLYYGYMWNKFYRREIFTNIKTPTGYWFEDMINDLVIFPSFKNIMVSNQITYSYLLNSEGITSTSKHSNKILDAYFVLKEIIDHIDDYKIKYTNNHFKRLLYQASSQIYSRLKRTGEMLTQHCFILLCQLINDVIEKYSINFDEFNKYDRHLIAAFKNHNYHAWKNISQFYK